MARIEKMTARDFFQKIISSKLRLKRFLPINAGGFAFARLEHVKKMAPGLLWANVIW
jgi:hypothetical protein